MISPMTRIEILCMKSLMTDLVAFVQAAGVVHVEQVPFVLEEEPGYLNPVRQNPSARQDQERLERLERHLTELAALLTTTPRPAAIAGAAVALRGTQHENWDKVVRDWNRTLRPLARSCQNLEDNVQLIGQYLQVLSSLAPQVDSKRFRLGEGTRFIVLPSGSHAQGRHFSELVQEQLGPEVRFLCERMGRHAAAGLLLFPAHRDEAVTAMLSEAGVTLLEGPETPLRGLSIDEALPQLRERMREQQRRLDQARQELHRISRKDAPRLLAMKSMLGDLLEHHRVAAEEMAESQLICVMHGWIPEESYDAFANAMETHFGNRAIAHRLPLDDIPPERIPTKLKNNRLFRPFELLLQLYPPPTYGALDPSAWVGISFVFFYGFIMADVVYGLIILFISWQVWKRFYYKPMVPSLCLLGTYMGLSTAFFGVLFGEYMGNLGYYLFHIQPIWIHRISGVMVLLYFSLIIGVIHVGASLLMGIYVAKQHGKKEHVYEKTGVFSAFCGMLIAVLGGMGLISPASACCLVGAALVLLGLVLLFLGMGKGAFIQSIELISLVTNVMSYSRLMALGMASTALADVGNHFFESGSNPWVGAGIDFSFQVLNICMGLFSPTLHSLRLNYVESLPKFYVPEGHPFKPLRKELPW